MRRCTPLYFLPPAGPRQGECFNTLCARVAHETLHAQVSKPAEPADILKNTTQLCALQTSHRRPESTCGRRDAVDDLRGERLDARRPAEAARDGLNDGQRRGGAQHEEGARKVQGDDADVSAGVRPQRRLGACKSLSADVYTRTIQRIIREVVERKKLGLSMAGCVGTMVGGFTGFVSEAALHEAV